MELQKFECRKPRCGSNIIKASHLKSHIKYMINQPNDFAHMDISIASLFAKKLCPDIDRTIILMMSLPLRYAKLPFVSLGLCSKMAAL